MANVSPQTRIKVSLKMAISKLRFTQEKKTALAKQQRRQLADLLRAGKEESARIRVENVVREDIYVELCEILELYCELLLARLMLLDAKECDPGLQEAVKTIIYATPHTEVKELAAVRDILVHRFGTDFYKAALANDDNTVPKKVVERVKVTAPSQELVSLYLKEIARAYNVPFLELSDNEDDLDQLEAEALEFDSDDDSHGSLGVKNDSKAAIQVVEDPLDDDVAKRLPSLKQGKPIQVTAPGKTIENLHPQVKVPDDMAQDVTKGERKKSSSMDLEELQKRFAALKRGG